MTYKDILASFKSELQKCLDYKCIYEKIKRTDSDTSETEYIDNDAKVLIDSYITEMDLIYESIFNALNSLFVDPDDDNKTPDTNFIIINGYADGSRSLEYYDIESEEFSEKADYWYVRGNLYDMLPKANEGLYIYKYQNNIKNIVQICNKYNVLYKDYPEPPVSGDDLSLSPSKIELFWDEYYIEFKNTVSNEINNLLSEKNKFSELVDFIRDYKNTFESVSSWLSKGDAFVSALQKTSTQPGSCLADSFSNINIDGFKLYSEAYSLLYSLYIFSKEERDASSYSKKDDTNMYLRKIFNSEILIHFDYFNKSVQHLNWIKEFRKYYNI